MITVYAKRSEGNVNIYSDLECKEVKGRFNKDLVRVPNKRRNRIIINCWTYNLVWV